MTTFKVLRLTTEYPLRTPNNQQGSGDEFFKRVTGGADLPNEMTLARIAAIADVFGTGRDCFYDEGAKLFATDLTDFFEEYPTSRPAKGIVVGWDVRIPASGDCQLRVYVRQDSEPFASSAVILQVPDDQFTLALAIVRSERCFYDGGALRTFMP